MKKLFLTALCGLLSVGVYAQRVTDKLDRGLVAVPSGSGSFVSWRIFAEEYYDTEYNLYRDGVKVNSTPLKVSNYTDASGKAGSTYQVAAVVRGKEQAKCPAVPRLTRQYLQFSVGKLYSRRGTDITSSYDINDIALADVDGDGVSEFILKRNYTPDKMSVSNDSAYNCLDCYTISGQRLWYIDLGPNMVSGPDEQYDAVGYDWDGDGKAEVLMRGADNMIIHHPDGTTTEIGNMKTNTRGSVLQDGNSAYTNQGAEYLLYLEGATGKPYPIGANGQLWMTYPLPRGAADDWGDGYGHRSTKHYFGAPVLDGRKPYVYLGRGCYTKHHMKAYSVNPQTHHLTLYWEWESGNTGPYFGQGYHNFGIADVDWDGRDEICFGSMVIDDNGKGLSTSGLGHGDAQHCSDFDPYRHGQEIFACNESQPAMNYRNATTSKIYYRLQSTGDDGRAMCGNFSNAYPGAIGHSTQTGVVSCVADKIISGAPSGFANNWRIYWDGDLLEEALDGASSREGASRVFKADGTVLFTADGTANCNWTKNTPSASGDILGDWREEIIVRTTDNKYVRIYTTNIETKWRNYTLWHDHQYRQAMVWESMGYNQPPHASYFLGELEDITVAPPPYTMTDRTEIANGETISQANNNQHVIVCETANTQVTLGNGVSPWVATFNVPSWVQGTNSTVTTGSPKINYRYYTCDVTGGYLTGASRLVKQGDGILSLPATDFQHTGGTDIWAGTVNFDGKMLKSSVWMNRFAELNSDGGQFRSIQMLYDAKLRPGRAGNRGTVTTDSLLLGFGARVVFDVYNDDFSADAVNAGVMTIETKKWTYGPKYLTPVFELVIHNADGTVTDNIAEGRFLLGTVGKLTGELADIRLEGMNMDKKCELLFEDGKLYLNVAGLREPTTIVWNGQTSNIWELAGDHNFSIADDMESADNIFVSGDYVRFDDTAAKFSVSLKGDIEADTVEVSGSRAYTFSGQGAIMGKTTLVKRGSGKLTINNTNSYTGGTRLSGGTVIVKSLANANQADGALGAVATNANKFVMENGAELQTTAAVTNGSSMKMEGEEGGVVNNSADYVVARAVSGTQLTKKGDGWMKLNVSNASLNRLVIAAGTVQCVNCNTPAKTVEFRSGTLLENTSSSYAIDVPKGRTGTWTLSNRAAYSNKLTGAGTITINCPTEAGNGWYATRTEVACNFSQFEGIVKPQSTNDPDKRFTMNTSSGMPFGTMNIPDGVVVLNGGKPFHIGKLSGKGSLGGSCTFSNGASVGVNTWQVGNDQSWAFNGKVTADANLVKVGTGRITWNGANDNTGYTTIKEGELVIGTKALLGKGKLTVAEGAALMGSNTSSNPLQNSAYEINGTVMPGTGTGSTQSIICFNDKDVTFAETSELSVAALQGATATSNGCASVSGIGKLTFNGTIRVVAAANNTLAPGDFIRLWTAKSMTGTPKIAKTAGIVWDDSHIQEGLLYVKSLTTGIHATETDGSNADVYDLQGRRMKTVRQLPQGVYMRGGKKFVVK